MIRAAATVVLVVASALTSYAVWLIATPDYDGGRRPVGLLILLPALALLVAALFGLFRRRGSDPEGV